MLHRLESKITCDISVVIPFYNRSAFAKRLLDSVLIQTFKPAHIYFIDNGSSTVEIQNLYKVIEKALGNLEITLVSTVKKGNANYARNLGMELAETRYVAFLDSDDWWEANHLEESVNSLRINQKSASYSGARIHYGYMKVNNSDDIDAYNNVFDFLFSRKKFIAQTSSYVIDTERLQGVSWDESLKRHQDYDFFAKVHYNSDGWLYIRKPTTNIDWSHGSSKSTDYKSMIRFLLIWESYFNQKTLARYILNQNIQCFERQAPLAYQNYYKKKFKNLSQGKIGSCLLTTNFYLASRRSSLRMIKMILKLKLRSTQQSL